MSYLKLFLIAGVCLLGSLLAPTSALAQYAPFDLNGYAWSSNIGWISLNCLTGSTSGTSVCGTSSYKVSVESDGDVVGYAWSSNIGWIQFGGLSGFPTGGGTTATNAEITGAVSNATMRGWARACEGTLGGTCASMANSNTVDNWGGWDGWIALSGTNHAVRIDTTSDMIFGSYAWGSTTTGYIDMFSMVSLILPTITLTGTGCTIAVGASTCNTAAVTWAMPTGTTLPDVYNSTRSEVVNSGLSGTDNSVTLNRLSNTIQARSNGSVLDSITLEATCPGAWVAGVCTAAVGLPPAISISAQPPLVRFNRTSKVSWEINPSPLTDGSCLVQGPGITPASGYPTNDTGEFTTEMLTGNATYRITCTGSYGVVRDTATVDVVPEGGES